MTNRGSCLDDRALAAWAQQDSFGWDIRCFDSCPSTNLIVKDAIRAGASEGTLAVALQQVSGYGRQGRPWVSPYGGLYFSFLLRPQVAADCLASIGPALSFSVRRTFARLTGDDAILIKWPNDVVCPKGKLCGMSCEMTDGALCIGIGTNVFRPQLMPDVGGKNRPAYLADRLAPQARAALAGADVPPAAALSAAVPDPLQTRMLEGLLIALLSDAADTYRAWTEEGFAAVHDEYAAHAALIGDAVTVAAIDGTVLAAGTVAGIDASGCLQLREADGALHAIASGEVHLV